MKDDYDRLREYIEGNYKTDEWIYYLCTKHWIMWFTRLIDNIEKEG